MNLEALEKFLARINGNSPDKIVAVMREGEIFLAKDMAFRKDGAHESEIYNPDELKNHEKELKKIILNA